LPLQFIFYTKRNIMRESIDVDFIFA